MMWKNGFIDSKMFRIDRILFYFSTSPLAQVIDRHHLQVLEVRVPYPRGTRKVDLVAVLIITR